MDHGAPSTPAKHHVGVHSSDEGFLAVMVPFLREGIAAEDEPDPAAVTTSRKLDLLRDALGPDARHVDFLDSARWYRGTPANSMATALDYYVAHASPEGRLHLAGEPVWPGRSPRQISEWKRYEALATELFTGAPPDLMCLYDTRTAPPDVIDAARHTHPTELHRHGIRPSPLYTEPAVYATQDLGPLPAPPRDAIGIGLDGDLTAGHRFAADQAQARGMAPDAAARFGRAVSGATGYAASQGCDRAYLKLWSTRERVICELRTPRGRITDPFLGFRPPGPGTRPEDGLWDTRQVCEFVDMRSGDEAKEGWTIRMETALVPAG
ncbi:MEDS domain-containing protein [Streptomyces fulvoviolaceus]|uniref:MEDS domain-containing protein n=1 Tax=Streptomyces fulvoviolaceus TaxID=285535 RepID=UPI0021C2405B|nr:MEDS domain-containing protein [Streptomyces fulvoviolaceus]MCT9079548.1 MEDS domain-containing protein [Streptomyces fulvoviolaceus]